MRFFQLTVLSLTALTTALPTSKRSLKFRQAGGPVLADTTYDAISISGGQAGNAEQEALNVFSALDLNNPGNIDAADIEFLGAVNDVANDAETEAFNPAIEAADGAEATALQVRTFQTVVLDYVGMGKTDCSLQNGKIKNKVLKLMATKIELEAKQAQGEDVADKLAAELKKLNNNIALDQEAAGQASTAVAFDGTISGGGNVAAAAGGAQNNAVAGGVAGAAADEEETAGADEEDDEEAEADDEED